MSNEAITNKLLSYFPDKNQGVFVEVGAAHPVNISISKHFRELGWQIISIEPIPEHCDEFRKLGLGVHQFACSSNDLGLTQFFSSPNLICCSSFKVEEELPFGWSKESFKQIDVIALKLDTILKVYYPEVNEIDVLVVDAEGWELEIMKGFDLEKYNPQIVCIEGHPCEEYMKNKGYELVHQIYQDKIYRKKK